jgi:hypothetical protein
VERVNMLKFNEKLAAKRLMRDDPSYPFSVALNVVRARRDIDERLHPAFMTWFNGGIPAFEYEGFTLEGLKKLTRAKSYCEVFLDMDDILKNPKDEIPFYKNKLNFVRM